MKPLVPLDGIVFVAVGRWRERRDHHSGSSGKLRRNVEPFSNSL